MNFNDLMARMRELDQPVAEGQIEECGDMPSMSPMGMPHEDPKPSMSLNLNAQGLDNIAELMKLMTKVNPDMINQKDTAIPTSIPTSNEPEIEIIPMDKPMAKPMGAPPMADLMKTIGDIEDRPEPDNGGKDIDGVDIAGGDHEEPEDESANPDDSGDDEDNYRNHGSDNDGAAEDPKGWDDDEEKDEAFGNAPTGAPGPEVKDTDYMVNQLAGGMNRPKQQFKHSYRAGDNPMAMPESDLRAQIKAELSQRLAEAKANIAERDEGKHNNGKTTGFKAVAKKAAKEYGSKEAGERVAGAVRAKMAKAGKL
jgi:hypothetical protein